jgi:tetratricopeptide (TPR) repeat protein
LALFFKKKPDAAGDGGAGAEGMSGNGDGSFKPDPEKARKWFEYARAAADSSNFEYALTCYANGIKLDPEAMSAHEAMYEVGAKYLAKGGKSASGKEIRGIEDGGPISRFAAAEFAWMKDLSSGSLALKALEAAIKSEQLEFGHWCASRVLGTLRRQKKVSKGQLVQAKDLFKQVNAWNEALLAGQLALQMDPTDSALDHELKDISAQRAMDQGGYEQAAGKEGGFRGMVKDSERQRHLQESEAIAANMTTEQRNLLRAKEAYENTPEVPDVLNQYAQLVKKQGTPEAEQLAFEVYTKGYADTGEYRFRMFAGDIRIEQAKRAVAAAASKLKENPSDAILQATLEGLRTELLALESAEYSERAQKYPTNNELKLRLGETEFALGNLDSAMAAFQAAKEEPKLRVRAGHMLGRAFAKEGWHSEAIGEFKEALAAIDASEKERELGVRYNLMESLIEHARSERSVELAKEALEICSGIARKDITFRDIRNRRKEIDQLIKDLSGTPGEA